jgi:hypothetical protein
VGVSVQAQDSGRASACRHDIYLDSCTCQERRLPPGVGCRDVMACRSARRSPAAACRGPVCPMLAGGRTRSGRYHSALPRHGRLEQADLSKAGLKPA